MMRRRLFKTWDESKHPRDKRGRFSNASARLDQQEAWAEEDERNLRELTDIYGSNIFDIPEQKEYDPYEPGGFINAVKSSLQHWLAEHTNPVGSARGTVAKWKHSSRDGDMGIGYIFSQFFAGPDPKEQKLRKYVAAAMARDTKDQWGEYWPGHGVLRIGETPEQAWGEEEAWALEHNRKNGYARARPPKEDDIADEILARAETDEDRWIDLGMTWDHIEKALIERNLEDNDWENYRLEIQDSFGTSVDDAITRIYNAYKAIERAPDNSEMMQAALWASHIAHVFGKVVAKHGEIYGIDYSIVNEIQQGSPAEFFGQEALDEFMDSPERHKLSKAYAAYYCAPRLLQKSLTAMH